jgi:hypothetical protein
MELLTGLYPIVVREIVDDSLFEELPTLLQQVHKGDTPIPVSSAAAMQALEATPSCRSCKWPAKPLQKMCIVAAKCARLQAKMRTTIAEVLPELEQLASDCR